MTPFPPAAAGAGPAADNLDRFVLFDAYDTNLPTLSGFKRARVELLVDPDSVDGFWAVIPIAGVAAAGDTPGEAALAAMRAACAMLSIESGHRPPTHAAST